MAERKKVFIHIGAPKTGTTYLQQVLDQNREAMKEAGVLYPRIHLDAHHTAVWDLRGTFEDVKGGKNMAGHWDELVRQTADWDGHTVVMSSEMFVYSDAEEARRILGSFGDAEVHVIYGARDLVRQIPAVWQEQVKNRRVMPYCEFLDDVLGKRRRSMSQHFWTAQDAPAALKRWSQGIAPQHVHVLTAPPSGSAPDLLWQRFAGILGLDAAEYPSEISAANTSLGVTSAEVLRRFNLRYGKDIPILRFRGKFLTQLMPALTEAVEDRSKLPLSGSQRRRIVELSEETVKRLAAAGYDVVGSLGELVPQRPSRNDRKAGRGPDDLSEAEVIDALLDVLHHVMKNAPRRGSAS